MSGFYFFKFYFCSWIKAYVKIFVFQDRIYLDAYPMCIISFCVQWSESDFINSIPPPFALISKFKGLRHVKSPSSPDFCLLSCYLSPKKSYTSLGKRNCCAYISLKIALEKTQINLSIIALNWFLPGAIGLQLSSALISMANGECWLAE